MLSPLFVLVHNGGVLSPLFVLVHNGGVLSPHFVLEGGRIFRRCCHRWLELGTQLWSRALMTPSVVI